MRTDKKIELGIIFLMVILSFSFVSAVYSESNPGIFQFVERDAKSICEEEGRDFLLQIAPFGCTPAVVRSDLLEEQNVPIFCQLAATQVNPLIDVEAISSVSFKGNYSKEIAGIGFYPAKAAISAKKNLNSAALNNVGYIVVTLKKQSNESAMPNFVEGNLSAKIKYDVKSALGIGRADFYLPVLSDTEWNTKYPYYSFWDGKGYIRANDITNTEATISVYDKNLKRLTNVRLEKGEDSQSLNFPGFDCFANYKLKLNSIANPSTRAKLRVNAEVVEVGVKERFLDNKCQVRDLINQGISKKIKIKCDEDAKGFFGDKEFTLEINPIINISVGGVGREVENGEYLYDYEDKAVYVGYIGTKGNTENVEDLFVYFVAIPKPAGSEANSKLSDDQINSFSELVKRLHLLERKTGVVAIDVTADFYQAMIGAVQAIVHTIKGENSFFLSYKDNGVITPPHEVFGRMISINGFAEAADADISETYLANYENALEDYDKVIGSFSQEKYPEDADTELGEDALFKKIELMNSVGKKRTMLEFCEEFTNDYPNSNKNLDICNNKYKIANSETSETFVLINGKTKKISFDDVYEPSLEDYNAEIAIKGPNGKTETHTLTMNDLFHLDELREGIDKNEFIQIIDINDDTIEVRLNVAKKGAWEDIKGTFLSDTKTLKLGTPEDFGTDYVFSLNKAPHIKKSAKVSLIPDVDNAESTAEFSFRVGIEKRWNMTLVPEMTKKTIESLNKTIGTFENISNVLGNVTGVMSKACLATGVALVAKNFVEGLSGESIARQAVMRGANGWYEICNDLVSDEKYASEEQCLISKSGDIEKEVDFWSKIMNERNSGIKAIEAKYPGKEQLLGKTTNTNRFMEDYSSTVVNKLNSLGTVFSDPNGQGESIDLGQMKTILNFKSWQTGNYDTEQLKQIELYTEIINSDASDESKAMAEERLYSDFLDLQLNYQDYVKRTDTAESFGIDPSKFTFLELENTKKAAYEGLTYGNVASDIPLMNYNPAPSPFPVPPSETTTISSSTPIQLIQTSDGNLYMAVLDDLKTGKMTIRRDTDGLIVYNLQGARVPSTRIPSVLERTYFEKYDENSYKNNFKNPEAKYYETEPYKGLPAVVPFDTANGWYAATKPTMPVLGQLSPYDASARVTNFYLCNVGGNGLEEFNSLGFGDDFCQMVNLGTNQPYNKISGLDERESAKKVEAGVLAIEQARNQYSSGASLITIDAGYGQIRLKVGSPAVEMPEIKCQDFMSPKECQIMFNVCDPVICPSSRCDFGGAYPVKDVTQSGIVGSIMLCMPNFVGFGGDVYIPVCLTGVQAGIDGLVSVQKSYRDCLQKSLDTGETVGICDEIHSLYICDFFWRQAAPLANVAIPKIISALLGQNTHGGGEYLFAQSAWDTAQKSLSSFTSYYQTNSPKAFQVRSVSEFVGDEICKVYTSATYPNGADIISSITTTSSPPQFHGRFDEISFTTVTVPPQSQYKVFYHIFAGKEQGAYYQVYLRGDSTSFYQDTALTKMVASGYIGVGEYASETTDFLSPSGYKEMCINVNGQEECGFNEVSTSFAVDYIKEAYVSNQAQQSDIITEQGCISDADNGIIRICSTGNPEKGTDNFINTSQQRWIEVGYCGDEELKCWLDTQSVRDVIDIATIEENALEEITNSYLANLTGADYLNEEGFESKLTEIERETDNEKKIELINKIIDKIYYINQKGYAFLLRGNAFSELVRMVVEQEKSEEEIEKTGSFYSLSCNECINVGCAIERCYDLCPNECKRTSTSPASTQTTPTTTPTISPETEKILSYECENNKRKTIPCTDSDRTASCVCKNNKWECGTCAGQTAQQIAEKAAALDMVEKGIYECTGNEEVSYECKFVCVGQKVNCECQSQKWQCEQCENKCSGTAGKLEDESSEKAVKEIEKIKQSAGTQTTGGETLPADAYSISDYSDRLVMPDETSASFISSTMEYKDGKPTWGNVFYRFFNKQWYWTQDTGEEKRWVSVTHLPQLGEENRNFITSLQGKTYSQGLTLMIDRTVSEGNSRGLFQIKPKISSYYAEMGYTKQFTFRYKRGVTSKYVFLRYTNEWEWAASDNPDGWMVGVKLGGNFYGEPVTLVEYLKNKNFFDGAKMMFMLEYEGISSVTPIVVEKTFRVDRVGFKIGSEIIYDRDVLRTGAVELIVDYEDNCQWLKYLLWKEGALAGLGDLKVAEDNSRNVISTVLSETTTKGKYHVDVLCFNEQGKSIKTVSKNLEVR